jgi:hypothetical protein
VVETAMEQTELLILEVERVAQELQQLTELAVTEVQAW